MASSVFYKFRSQREESRITFNGTGISVFDLKREIILANNLGKANDFDLYVYDAATNQEFPDDAQIIQRSSSIVVKRLPSAKPGRGKAAMYIANANNNNNNNNSAAPEPSARPASSQNGPSSSYYKGVMSKRFDGKEDPAPAKTATPAPAPAIPSDVPQDEAAAMAAMFQAQTANWEEAQEKMSHATRVYTNTRGTPFARGGKPHAAGGPSHHAQSDKPLPPSYVCYRCGQKGHWIKDCPTNNDRDFDHRPRIKRTTGIPRSMLKAVDNPDGTAIGQGVMVTPEGGYVVAQPDAASWQKQVYHRRGLTAPEVRAQKPTDPTLICPIDSQLFLSAIKTPCCSANFCEECAQTYLLEHDFACPKCAKRIPSLDKLGADKPMRVRVEEYINKAIEESKKDESGSEEAAVPSAPTSIPIQEALTSTPLDQDLYTSLQPGSSHEMSQIIVDSIPQLQAQIMQISVMLQNPNLPAQVRQTTEMQYGGLQMQLQQAQAVGVALEYQQQQVMQQQQMQMQHQHNQQHNQQQQGQKWTNPYAGQAPAGVDSAYQRLPMNNRRKNLKRDRPSDFLDVGEREDKMPRYWE